MKKFILFTFVGFCIGYLTAPSAPAQAFPGAMCFNSSGCGHCEVCVKPTWSAPTGTCMAVAGCY